MSLAPLYHKRKVLIEYLKEKLEEEDFHGVRDVCTDLEKLDVQIETIQQCKELIVPMHQGWDISQKPAEHIGFCGCETCMRG